MIVFIFYSSQINSKVYYYLLYYIKPNNKIEIRYLLIWVQFYFLECPKSIDPKDLSFPTFNLNSTDIYNEEQFG